MIHLQDDIEFGIQRLVYACFNDSSKAGWWQDEDVTNPLIVPAKIALIHSELSEALEGHRKDLQDDHLPEYRAVTVELADAVIRICDLAGFLELPLAAAILDKLEYNRSRADHKPEARNQPNGKKY
jgi:hypothetical protein